MTPTVMVLGATGCIGGHAARALGRGGYTVRATRRPSSETWHVDDVDIDWVEADLDGDIEELEEAFEPCEALVDCAGYAPRDGTAIDRAKRRGVARLRRVVLAARRARVQRVVYVSSPATLGIDPSADDGQLREHDFYVPGTVDNAYHEAKFSMEAEVYRFLEPGPPVAIAIPGAVFGPGDVKPSTGQFLLEFARGRVPFRISGEVNAVDVRDVAETLVRMLREGRGGRRYILGGENATLDDLFRRASHFCDAEPPDRELPAGPLREGVKWMERAARTVGYQGESPLIGFDHVYHARPLCSERAENELGHDPRSLDHTLQDTYDWFRDHDYL